MTPQATDTFEYSAEYLASAGACALISGSFSFLLLLSGWGLSEFTNWILSKAGVSFRFLTGYSTALLLIVFVTMVLLRSSTQGRISPPGKSIAFLMFSGSVTLALIGFALAISVFEILKLSFTTLLVVTYFVFCYSEMFPVVRKSTPGP